MPIPQQAAVTAGFAAAMRPSIEGGVSDDAVLAVAPNDRFFLRHHPLNWRLSTTLEEPTYLPEVSMMILAPGVNGVRTLNRGEQPVKAYEDAVTKAERQGWTFLHPNEPVPEGCLPEGVPAGGYRRELPCRDPVTGRQGLFFLEAWNVPLPARGDDRQRFSFDRAAYERWLVHLVESGQVAPMDPSLADDEVKRVQGHVERVEAAPLPDAVRERRTAQKQQVADQHEAARDKARGKTTPDPKAKARSRSKA